MTELGSSMQIRFQKSINCVHAFMLPFLATFRRWKSSPLVAFGYVPAASREFVSFAMRNRR